ncbi:MAG TPA: ATP-binding protein [Chryseolinea sp.]|nr:ATP-binding protein [Chryseolinea sp.]
MRNFRIFTKLFLTHSAVGLFALITLSIFFYAQLRDALIDRTLDQLSSINILKKELVENYLFRSQQNLEALIIEHKFLKIYHELLEHRVNAQTNQDIADVGNLRELYNFKNLHVFDTHHRQLFSTDEEMYPDGLLSRIDSAISTDPGHIRIIDASAHSLGDETLLFYYVPIIEETKLLGSVLVQENFEKIQSILLETTGMGSTGESYIVGSDFRMRSASRFFPDTLPGLINVNTIAVQNSFRGQPGTGLVKDYRGVPVLSAYRQIENTDLSWAIISEIDEREAMQPILSLRNYLVITTVSLIILTLIVTFVLSNAIVRPILKLKEIILTLSKGMMPKKLAINTSTDEIGEMALAIQQLTDGLERTSRFANEIGGGNFNTSFTKLSNNDKLGQSLLEMRDELRGFHDRELKSTRARASALLEGQERERKRIINELHDGVGQMLTIIRMQVDILDIDSNSKQEIKTQINEAIAEVKRISYHVMPQAIVDFGLEAALRGLCDTLSRYSGIAIDFRYVQDFEQKLDFEISISLFRIVQEGLNNIAKHADASNVSLHLLDKEDEVYCILEDNGKGFNEVDLVSYAGSGLRNIRERAALLNGSAEILSKPGSGTTIEIHIPKRSG